MRNSLLHSIALQLPGAKWSLLNTSLNSSTSGAGACWLPVPPQRTDTVTRTPGRPHHPGVRESGELLPRHEASEAEARESAFRSLRQQLLPISGEHCLVVVAPAVHAPEFNVSLRGRLGYPGLGLSKKAFRARRATGNDLRVEHLVHWV